MIEPSSPAINSLAQSSMFQFPQVSNNPLHSLQSQRSPVSLNDSSIQEDIYHQYHEAVDIPSTTCTSLHSPTLDNSKMTSPLLQNFNARSPLSPSFSAELPHLNSPTIISLAQSHFCNPTSNIRSALTNNVSNLSMCHGNTHLRNLNSFDHLYMINQSINTSDVNNNTKSMNGSENQQNNNLHFNFSNSSITNMLHQNNVKDLSEDIYSCYVTSKKQNTWNNAKSSSADLFSLYDIQQNEPEKYEEVEEVEEEPIVDKTPINSPSMSPLSTSNLRNSTEPVELRHHCVRELIQTESNYVDALEMIIDCFAKPLERYLRKEDAMLIFNHIKQFHKIHALFHADLAKACKQSSDQVGMSRLSPFNSNTTSHTTSNPSTPTSLVNIPSPHSLFSLHSPSTSNTSPSGSFRSRVEVFYKLSSCFLHWKDKFVLYGDYCATLSKAQNLIDELCSKNELLSMKMDRCQQQANEGKFKLRDLLSLPMQRILKYHLLLAQIIKNTPNVNEDYYGLKRAYEAMLDLGQYINEVKRDTEALQIINDIQNSISELELPPDTHLVDYGRLVKDGELKVKSLDDSKVKNRYVFVFDKVILMCKSIRGVRGEQFCYKEALVLSEYDIDDSVIAANLQHARHATKEKWSYYFSLVKKEDKYIYTFFAKTLESKNKWLEYINKAMDNSKPSVCRQGKTNHAFLMHTFDKATNCDHCLKLLYGRYYQGYRCQVCNLSAHKQCLIKARPCRPPSVPLKYLSNRPLSSLDLKEPPSPSMKSNCSDDSNNVFSNISHPEGVSPDHNFMFGRQRYSNFNESNSTNIIDLQLPRQRQITLSNSSSRDVTSVINLSLQNSSNNLIEQKRMMGLYSGSKSTPAINQLSAVRVIATSSFEGQNGQLTIKVGDTLAVYQSMIRKNPRNDAERPGTSLHPNKSTTTWWLGKNLRTGQEGHFPSNIVEVFQKGPKRVSYEDPQHTLESIDDLLESRQPRYGNVSPRSINIASENVSFFGGAYVNYAAEDYPWFLGRMERDRAQMLLENTPHETFLVRISLKQNGCYVISLNYNGQVKHMRIHVTEDEQLFLSQSRYFKSLIELVTWYQRNSLMESFHLLDARLVIPFRGSNR